MAVSPNKPRVLLVDGDPLTAMHVEAALRHVGWDVVGPTGKLGEALKLAEAEPLDAAALDVEIGGGVSFPVAEALAARGVPFVFVSAYAGEFPPGPLGSAPRLDKPCRVADVLASLERARAESLDPSPLGLVPARPSAEDLVTRLQLVPDVSVPPRA